MAFTTAGLLIASAIASMVGAGVSAYSSVQAGKAAQAANNYNAAISDQSALDASRDARIAAANQREQNRRIQARQRALFAKAGVVTATGSPLMVQVQQAGELEMSALELEQQGSVKAEQLRQQAVLDRMAGKSARAAGNLNAAGTILQGAGSALSTASTYKRYKGVG